ncbi:MAG TPA: DUF4390 domain-containing protein [Steroidobacteraceae bacterium]|nr:DUF4390 domain-containing protein [Steroidobacteraceae bacterium]
MSWLLWRARRQLARTGRQLARAACLSSIVLSPLAGLTLAQAQGPLDGTFQIDAAYVVLDHDVLELNSRVHYPDNEQIRRALQDGITLAFDVEVVIERPRRFWFNATLLDTTLRRELTYHAVTGRYVVRNEAGVSQQSFATLDEALEQLGDIEDLPILVQSQLGPGPWQVAVRAGVRRGRMPAALRALMFWNDDWHRLSGWYTWMLTL